MKTKEEQLASMESFVYISQHNISTGSDVYCAISLDKVKKMGFSNEEVYSGSEACVWGDHSVSFHKNAIFNKELVDGIIANLDSADDNCCQINGGNLICKYISREDFIDNFTYVIGIKAREAFEKDPEIKAIYIDLE